MSRLTLLGPNAKPLHGWPVDLDDLVSGNCLAAGDVDGDGRSEIVAVDVHGRVHVLTADGKKLDGYPVTPPETGVPMRPPIVSDLDGDGAAEIAFAYARVPMVNLTDGMVVISAGKVRTGWPLKLEGSPMSNLLPMDADKDGKPELLAVGTDGRLRAYGLDGRMKPSPNVDLGKGLYTLLQADMGGDDITLLAISCGDGPGDIRAMNPAGRILSWPARTREKRWGAAALMPWKGKFALVIADIRDSRIKALDGAGTEIASAAFDGGTEGVPFGYGVIQRGTDGIELVVGFENGGYEDPDWDYHFERLATPLMRKMDRIDLKILEERYPAALRARDPKSREAYLRDRREFRHDSLIEYMPDVVPVIVASKKNVTARVIAFEGKSAKRETAWRIEDATVRLREFWHQDVYPAAAVEGDNIVIAIGTREGAVMVKILKATGAPRVFWGGPMGGPSNVPIAK